MLVKIQIAPGMFNWVEDDGSPLPSIVPGPQRTVSARVAKTQEVPCVHLGVPLRRVDGMRVTAECHGCTDKVQANGKVLTVSKPVHVCAMEGIGQCLPSGESAGIQSCSNCAYRSTGSVPDLLPGLPDPLPVSPLASPQKDWATSPAVINRHIATFQKLLATSIPPPPKADGDGILIVGGGKYWPMIVVAVKMAREVTSLPIQIWHRGSDEPVRIDDLAGVADVEVINAKTYPVRILTGWATKSLAILHCGWKRVLFMDADAYLLRDPQSWLDMATEEKPFVFWQDLPAQNTTVKWPMFGLANNGAVPVQGGQLAIHRQGMWRTLVVFHWLNQHSDYYYHHGFGDQDCWPPALVATDCKFLNLGLAPWIKNGYQLSLGGKPFIVHRSKCKWWGDATDKCDQSIPGELRAWRYLRLPWLRKQDRYFDLPIKNVPRTENNRVDGLITLLEMVRPKTCIEIGCYAGVSSEVIALHVDRLVCVDPCPNETIYRMFTDKMAGYHHVEIIRGCSPDAIAYLPAGSFDACYIDGEHSAVALRKDIDACRRLVKPGGWITGHDLQIEDVASVVHEMFGEPLRFKDDSWAVQVRNGIPIVR